MFIENMDIFLTILEYLVSVRIKENWIKYKLMEFLLAIDE